MEDIPQGATGIGEARLERVSREASVTLARRHQIQRAPKAKAGEIVHESTQPLSGATLVTSDSSPGWPHSPTDCLLPLWVRAGVLSRFSVTSAPVACGRSRCAGPRS